MKITAAKCNVCSDIVYSRAIHDMRWCSCGNVLVMEEETLATDRDKMEDIEIDVPYTKEEIFMDWNLDINKLGLILGYEIDSGNQESNSNRRVASGQD